MFLCVGYRFLDDGKDGRCHTFVQDGDFVGGFKVNAEFFVAAQLVHIGFEGRYKPLCLEKQGAQFKQCQASLLRCLSGEVAQCFQFRSGNFWFQFQQAFQVVNAHGDGR